MTGFASGTGEIGGGSLTIDLKSVNHRHLDLQFRIAEEFRFLEPQLRKLITQNIARGKIDCRITFKSSNTEKNFLKLDKEMVKNIGKMSSTIHQLLPNTRPLSINEILHWPGVIIEDEKPIEALTTDTSDLFSQTLNSLIKDREREGLALKDILLHRLKRIQELVYKIEPLLPDTMLRIQERISKRLEESNLAIDQDRLHQELILHATKTDIDEEFNRLKVHLQEAISVCSKGGVCGKRLDFIAQELHRESNTLNAKSVDLNITQINVEIKTLIEQLREQIQNIE